MIMGVISGRYLAMKWAFLGSLVGVFQGQGLYFPPITGDAWDTISPRTLGWNEAQIDSLYAFLAQHRTKAFILLKDGKIVLEWYFGRFTKDSLWYWASAGKGLTAFLVGLAQQEGFLRITDTTGRWLGAGWTQAPPEKEALITIRHQLTMTTGLDDEVADPHCTQPSCLLYKADAGTRWAYHNAPYTLLHAVLEAATGRPVNQYFYEKVATRTGMQGGFISWGYNRVFVSNARSMARFGLLILNKGWWDQTPILTDTLYYREMLSPSQSLNPAYGYLWWLNGQSRFMVPGLQTVFSGPLFPSAPSDMVSALGANGQILSIVPSQRLVVVRLGEFADSSEVVISFHERLWQRLRAVMTPAAFLSDSEPKYALPIQLYPNEPNPFTDETVITFEVREPLPVSLKVYNMWGEELATLKEGVYSPGRYAVAYRTEGLPAGVYWCRLVAGPYKMHRPLVKTGMR
jgi:CubicO group peptidase (beta-lactamase class C family)